MEEFIIFIYFAETHESDEKGEEGGGGPDTRLFY
jgi:hypothetical protein